MPAMDHARAVQLARIRYDDLVMYRQLLAETGHRPPPLRVLLARDDRYQELVAAAALGDYPAGKLDRQPARKEARRRAR